MNNTGKIAKNTAVQYVRLLVNIVIMLYSVRVILNALGASDYGIYDVIAGIIGLLGFINNSLNQTSIRYLSVSLGSGSQKNVKDTFNNSFWLHSIIAVSLSLLLEILSVFLFDNFLNIPQDRVFAAKFIYQCMIVNLLLQIVLTPFTALIISHENFVYTAVVSILDSFLKLAIAFCVANANTDKLCLYGILMLMLMVVNILCYVIYVRVKYRSDYYIGKLDVLGVKKQSGFAGWTLCDVLGSLATRQGYSIMLNIFFGTITNAAFSIARQVEGQLFYISSSVIDTMKPQIMKSYGAGEKQRMFSLSMVSGKLGFSMMSIVAVPLLVFMPEILNIWLKEVPEGTVFFTRLLVLACMIEQTTRGIVYACQATGNIKWFSIIVSAVRFSALPISIILFFVGLPAYSAFIVFVICELLGSISRVIVMNRLDDFNIGKFLQTVVLRIIPPFAMACIACISLKNFSKSLFFSLFVIIITCIIYLLGVYFISLSKDEKQVVNTLINKIIKR